MRHRLVLASPRKRLLFLRLALAAIGLLLVLPLGALPVASQPLTWQGFEQEILIGLMDRRGGFGGLTFDRGRMRRYTPEMDHEYFLDQRGAAFTLEDDRLWYDSSHGVRTSTGSIDKSRFATTTDIRHHIEFGSRHLVTFLGRQQEDLEARRFIVQGGYAVGIGGSHRIGMNQTMGGFKPDLDTEIYYEALATPAGDLRAGILLLDVFNNLIFDVLGVDPVLEDTVRSYSRYPRVVRARWLSPLLGRLQIEGYAGLHPPADADVTTQSNPSFAYSREDRFGYAGLIVHADLGRINISGRLGSWREQTAFRASPESMLSRNYRTRQHETAAAARLTVHHPISRSYDLSALLDLTHVRYRDRQTGSDFGGSTVPEAFDLRERRIELEAALALAPVHQGFRAALRLLTDSREYGDGLQTLERHFLRFAQETPNQRLSLQVGYQVRPGFFLEFGASYDIDGDTFYTDRGPTRFDGGFGRAMVIW